MLVDRSFIACIEGFGSEDQNESLPQRANNRSSPAVYIDSKHEYRSASRLHHRHFRH